VVGGGGGGWEGGGGGGGRVEGLGEKRMPVLLCLPQIKQDRPGFEPSIRGEGQKNDCLRQGTAS
jgi:hypothetical protein